MKTPEEWLDQQTADRPDDFAPEERAPALAWVAAIQADARIGRLAGLVAFIGRLFCHHHYRWVANIHGDAINHHGGLRSWWRCDRCGHETLSASLMPDIDALCDRLERENTIELPRDASSPDQREVMRLVGERMHERRAKAEQAERKRAYESMATNRLRILKAIDDALAAVAAETDGTDQLLRDRLAQAQADQAMLRRYAHAADRVFQTIDGTEPREAMLPGFLRLGDCKAEGIVRLAEAYIDLRDRHQVERDAHAKAVAERDHAFAVKNECCRRAYENGRLVEKLQAELAALKVVPMIRDRCITCGKATPGTLNMFCMTCARRDSP